MKSRVLSPLLLLVTATSLAERIAPPTLPASAFTDTEASTNIVMTPLACSRTFSVALEDLVVRHSPDGTRLIFQ